MPVTKDSVEMHRKEKDIRYYKPKPGLFLLCESIIYVNILENKFKSLTIALRHEMSLGHCCLFVTSRPHNIVYLTVDNNLWRDNIYFFHH